MNKLIGVLILLTVVINVDNIASHKVELTGTSIKRHPETNSCNCIEPVLIEMPSNAEKCECRDFITELENAIKENHRTVERELTKEKCDCDFKNVMKTLGKHRAQILKISKIPTNCGTNEKMLNDEISHYQSIKTKYLSDIRSATVHQSPECEKVLARIRPIVLNSAENILSAVLKCMNYKN